MKRININGKDYTDFAEAMAAVYDHCEKSKEDEAQADNQSKGNGNSTEMSALRHELLQCVFDNHSLVVRVRGEHDSLPCYIVLLYADAKLHRDHSFDICKAVAQERFGALMGFDFKNMREIYKLECAVCGDTESGGVLGFLSESFDGTLGASDWMWGETPIIVCNYIDFDNAVEVETARRNGETQSRRRYCGCCMMELPAYVDPALVAMILR